MPGKILIVDDDHDIRELLALRLQAAGPEPTAQAAVEAGARAFVPKPIDHELLPATVRQILGD